MIFAHIGKQGMAVVSGRSSELTGSDIYRMVFVNKKE